MPALDRSNNGALALHYAAARGCLDCVKLLIETSEFSANTQMDNDVTPVYLAAQEGHLEVLKFLVLEAGGSLYVRAKDGMAPVHAAAQMGCLTCLKWMAVVQYVAMDSDTSQNSIEYYSAEYIDNCLCRLCTILNRLEDQVQEQGVDPNLRDGDGATPLHFAASRGHIDTIRWLLRHGGRLTLDKYGKSPINDAAENQQIECLNILVQHGTIPDYQGNCHINGKLHGCVCRKGDPQQKCSYADCVNFSSPRAPFFLHNPGREEYPSHDGLYVNPMTNNHDSGSSVSSGSSESFYLHNPQDVVYNRVKDLFEGTRNEAPTINGLTVKVEVHSNSSGAGSEENLSSSDMSERSEEQEHDYEDIYHLSDANLKKNDRNRNGDSGSHSRSGSVSSTNSGGIIVKLSSQDRPSMTSTGESGVSSASPSDLGHSEEESEKMKISHRHSLPHHNVFSRQLKRVISEPGNSGPPPPPPPLPPVAPVADQLKNGMTAKPNAAAAASAAATENNGLKTVDRATKLVKTNGARQISDGNEEAAESENTSSGSGLVNKKLVLPFIPPTFSGGDCLIKPSEYLKSIGGSRSGSGNSFLHKTYTKCQEHKSNEPEDSKVNEANGPMPPPPPPLPDFTQKETAAGQEAVTSSKPKIQHQPLSAISIHDLNSVQLRRTTLQKTMSTPVKTLQPGGEPFQAQKQDLIAELKLSKDIEGVKKMKVERLKTEEKQEKELVSEIARQLNASTLLEKIPEKDSTGNPIPPWKRQMMAKKAAEKARKDLEEQMKKEAEEKRIQSIPAWKRQLLAKKEENESKPTIYTPKVVEEKKVPQVMLKVSEMIQTVTVPSIEISLAEENNKENSRPQQKSKVDGEQTIEEEEEKMAEGDEDTTQIIPWRAQLRKTNSKLSLLD